MPADGTAAPRRILDTEAVVMLESWSPSGRTIAFTEPTDESGQDIRLLHLDGEVRAETFSGSRFNDRAAAFSPDGRWLAYSSDDQGMPVVYVEPYPGSGPRQRVSPDGGGSPVWSTDGSELFYVYDEKVWAVDIEADAGFRSGTPKPVLGGPYDLDVGHAHYGVSADGRFLTLRLEERSPSFHAVFNWFQELERLVPND